MIVAREQPGGGREGVLAVARAWFGYVEAHPFVAAFLFDDATGDPGNAQRHAQMQDAARGAVQVALAEHLPTGTPDAQLQALAEMVRSSAVGLARWNATHQPLTTEQVAALAADTWLNALQR
ncbi:MAG: hypothetical protein EOP19_13245 [Hyphomicrobiales bacterium]|nr:MAG: hypothetical protein EOP19_13245 [Hyphomicrobiales bacterium]